jgi:hypothetical protein
MIPQFDYHRTAAAYFMALFTVMIDPNAKPLPEYIINKHWERKHGSDAYYGQK